MMLLSMLRSTTINREATGTEKHSTEGVGLVDGGLRLLAYIFTLRIPTWVEQPTAEAFGQIFSELQPQLGLDRLETPGVPPSCLMARGAALSIQIDPKQGLFQYIRNLEAFDGNDRPRVLDDLSHEFIAALSEARRFLRPVLFVSPMAQVRAAWPVTNRDARAFLESRVHGGLHPVAVGEGLVLGFHLVQTPVQVADPADQHFLDLKVEPFVRDLTSIWLEATYQYPTVAIPGAGIVAPRTPNSAQDAQEVDVSKLWECGKGAHALLEKAPAFLGQ